MKSFFYYVMAQASPFIVQLALSGMRIGIGALSVGHGYPKLLGGPAAWRMYGLAMSHLGITWWPEMWGLLAACTEFFCGVALVVGLCTRLAVLPLLFMMFVAFKMHVASSDPFSVYSFPLTLIVVFAALFFIGSGTLSLDALLTRFEG